MSPIASTYGVRSLARRGSAVRGVRSLLLLIGLSASAAAGTAGEWEPIRLAVDPALSPDGRRLAFSWHGDVWIAPIEGGPARPLTQHPAEDRRPCFSPDGRTLAFESERDGPPQVYVMPAGGGLPRRLTDHSEGTTPLEWTADGAGILCRVRRDHGGLHEDRLVIVDADGPRGERLLVDAYAHHGTVSPDGRRALIVREGVEPYRKGYRGSKAAQIWLVDLAAPAFTGVGRDPTGCRSPIWKPEGGGFYFVSGRDGSFNLWEHELASGEERRRTFFEDDGVMDPALSRDGSTMVFRRGFDLYRFHPGSEAPPEPIELRHAADRARPAVRRRWLQQVWNQNDWGSLDWSGDGLEMVFTAGGDAYVMDTVLREPRPLACGTIPYETEAVFTPDGRHILLVRDWGDRAEIWRATRTDPDRYWWRNQAFRLEPVVTNRTAKANLSVSPDGRRLAYAEHGRDLVVAEADGSRPRILFQSVDMPYYDWSPDGRWLACSFQDSHDNWDVWIVSASGDPPPYNLSRHPAYDAGARWSPDGRIIAFAGERGRDREVDLFYVYLREEDDRRIRRDRTLEEALKAMRTRVGDGPDWQDEPRDSASVAPPGDAEGAEGEADGPFTDPGASAASPEGSAPPVVDLPIPETAPSTGTEVHFDLEGLHQRLRRIALPGSRETSAFWGPDARALAFTSTIDGRRGTYQIAFPDVLEPEWMTARTGYYARWSRTDGKLLWLSDGVPHAYTTAYPFQVYQTVDLGDYRRLAFRRIWRTLYDQFYDPSMNGKDWEAMLVKYEPAAAAAPDHAAFQRAVEMLLGELNASHAGFDLHEEAWDAWTRRDAWEEETAHLGVTFERTHPGPGWGVRRVLEEGPADRDPSRLYPGDVVMAVDGRDVGRELDLPAYLNGPLDRTIRLTVRDAAGGTRSVELRPIRYDTARGLVRDARIRRNRAEVRRRTGGALAYVHVDRMEWEDVERFEEDLFSVAADARGLIIDVRNNEGGFAADYLLAMVCRPRHAVTVPRGGAPSYPRDYLPNRSWDRPLAVLCNQFTASNGEIFAHAIQGWGRGPVVGAPTQGAVISKTSRQILDLGRLDVPRRGWFRASDGRDLELNGVQPDIEIWPHPGEIPRGVDRQLDAAIDALTAAVEADPVTLPPLRIRAPDEKGPQAEITTP